MTEQGLVLVGGTLVLRRATVQDSGTYVCVVSNGAGAEEKNEIQLLITGECLQGEKSYIFCAFVFVRIGFLADAKKCLTSLYGKEASSVVNYSERN